MSDESTTGMLHEMPFTRVEVAILSIVNGELAILLAKRTGAPHKGKWALPGGVIRIDLDTTLEASAQRVAGERLQTALPYLRQLTTVGSKNRDPRAPWSLSVVYRALLPVESFRPNPGKRIEALQWFQVNSGLTNLSIAFDHSALIQLAVDVTHGEINRMDLPFSFLGEKFTLGELQACCEAIVGRRMDKSSFRRKLDDRALVEPIEGEMRTGGAFRPAQLFRQRAI